MTKLIQLLILSVLIFSGCTGKSDDEPMTFMDLGILNHYGDDYMIITDAKVVLLTKKLPQDFDFEENIRVSVRYQILGPAESNDNIKADYRVEIKAIDELLTKDIITINDENRDTLGSAPVLFNNVWITQDFLTVYFTFYAGEKNHFFNLTYDEREQTDEDIVYLTFRHQDNGDIEIKKYWGYVSFRLNNLRKEGKSEVKIHFRGKQFDEEDFQLDDLVYNY